MTLTTDKNSSGESILLISNPYNWHDFKHPEISVKIEITKPDGTKQELIQQEGVFNLGKLDNGMYNLIYFNESNCPDLTPPNNRGKTNTDSFEINDTTTVPPDDTSGTTTPDTTLDDRSITPSPAPDTPGRLGSALGLAAGTKITGNFVLGFQTEATSVMNGLADPTKLRQEVTNLLANWPEVSATITTRFNPNKITDDEIKGLATTIIGSLTDLNQIQKTTIEEALTNLTMERKVSLTKIIVAYNVEFPQKVERSLPGSGKGTSINDDDDIFVINKEEEDREEALKAEAAQLEKMVRKGEKDLTGLINLLTQPVQDENAENKKKLVLSQLQHTISDFENFKSHLAKTGQITVQENNLSEVKEMKEKIATLTEKQPIAMPAGWNADIFKPVKGIGKFKEYEAQLKKVNDLIDRQNNKRKEITKAAEDIDTNKLTTHFGRITKIRAQVEDFDKKLKALQQQLSTTTDAKQLAPIFTQLGKLLQDNYKDIKLERQEIMLFEKDIFGLINSMAKITKHNGKMRGITGWFEQMNYRNSGTLTEESKKLEDEREYLENLLKGDKAIATPTPVPTPVPEPPTPTSTQSEQFKLTEDAQKEFNTFIEKARLLERDYTANHPIPTDRGKMLKSRRALISNISSRKIIKDGKFELTRYNNSILKLSEKPRWSSKQDMINYFEEKRNELNYAREETENIIKVLSTEGGRGNKISQEQEQALTAMLDLIAQAMTALYTFAEKANIYNQ